MNALPYIDPRALAADFHTFLGIDPLHCVALADRYGAHYCLHIGNRAGRLSIRVQRDSAGIEVTVEQHTVNLDRVIAGTRLLLQHMGDLAAVRRPNALTDELHIGDTYFELPRNYTAEAVCWLRQQAPRHTRPFDPTEVTA
jgi:hypothetical protein